MWMRIKFHRRGIDLLKKEFVDQEYTIIFWGRRIDFVFARIRFRVQGLYLVKRQCVEFELTCIIFGMYEK